MILTFREGLIDALYPYFGMIKVISVLISTAFILGIIYIATKLNVIKSEVQRFVEITGAHGLSKRRTVRSWQQILRRLKAGDEPNLKLALIEADRILDEILKLSGYHGDSLGERLKQITPAQITNVQEVWQAHKMRNRIVHEPDFEISKREAEFAIRIYEKAFQELGLID